jgi:hypothetical protein
MVNPRLGKLSMMQKITSILPNPCYQGQYMERYDTRVPNKTSNYQHVIL